MCGIFGYVGSRTAKPILIDGLRTLEYRGYDSAGVFIPGYGPVKAVGPIDNLANKLNKEVPGTCGIAHSRWATHGAPTERNAHPHTDQSENIWIVHNGIIDNYRTIKEGLIAEGLSFTSDTDTEVLAKLIGSLYQGNLRTAVQEALRRVEGTYGLVVVSDLSPEEIIVARMGSPIVLGLGTDGNFVSSDPSALLVHTKDVVYMEDGEIATLTKDTYEVIHQNGQQKQKTTETIDWDIEAVQKQGFEHFMLKEIHEAPEVIRNTIRGRLLVDKGRVKLGGIEDHLKTLSKLDRLTIVACGSAYYAGLVGKYMLEEYADLPVDVELASEYRYKTNYHHKKSAVLAVTQSGETADTLAAVRKAKSAGVLTLGMVNVVGSSIARETDAGIYNHAGPEIAVASTKAFISQLTAFVLLTLAIAREKGMEQEEGKEILNALNELPLMLEQVLNQESQIAQIAKQFSKYENAMFIGRKLHTPIAYEGALKLKEVSYIHAEGYAGGELKHGSIALLDENFPVIALLPQDDVYDKMRSNVEEVKARNAPIIAIAHDHDIDAADLADQVIAIQQTHPLIQPIVSTLPLHLLAYYIGLNRGHNVDRPRNLAKSVTVE